MVLWVLVAVGVLSAIVVVAIVVALIRHLRRLGASAKRLAEDLPPILEEIQRDSDRARERVERISRSLPDPGR